MRRRGGCNSLLSTETFIGQKGQAQEQLFYYSPLNCGRFTAGTYYEMVQKDIFIYLIRILKQTTVFAVKISTAINRRNIKVFLLYTLNSNSPTHRHCSMQIVFYPQRGIKELKCFICFCYIQTKYTGNFNSTRITIRQRSSVVLSHKIQNCVL